jgi:flagellar basal-body rod protein FlgG
MSIRGLDVASTGLAAYSSALAIVSNNVANINTNGFKRSDVRFQDLLYDTFLPPGKQGQSDETGIGVQYGRGVVIASVPSIFQQGATQPGLDLDVAINGVGFFRVHDIDGNLFLTRLGAFQPKGVGSAGPLNLQIGGKAYTLDPPIVLPGNNAETTVDAFGVVRQGSFTAQLELTSIQNPDGLEQVGDLLFRETAASGESFVGTPGTPGFATLVGQSLEGSNVDLTNEFIQLIETQQAFNLSSQAFVVGNEEIRQAIALVQQS